MTDSIFNRSELLLGTENMHRIASQRIIIFGVGGVGSWCAESLIRIGFQHLTIVDSDCVAPSNCNRQLMATSLTIGQPKVTALKQRLMEINPNAEVTAIQEVYNSETASQFHISEYNYIIDAIDSIREKAQLILHATSLTHEKGGITFYSSMGAALRFDPTKVRVAEFRKVQGDALARAIRNKFKESNSYPTSKFLCVYSEEPTHKNLGTPLPEEMGQGEWNQRKVNINGSLCPVTATFGMTLASLVMQHCLQDEGISNA